MYFSRPRNEYEVSDYDIHWTETSDNLFQVPKTISGMSIYGVNTVMLTKVCEFTKNKNNFSRN